MTENYEQWKALWEKKHFYIQKSAKIGSMVSGKLKVYKCTLKGLSTYMVDPELHIPYYNEEFMKRWIFDMDKLYYYDTGS